MNTSKQQKIDSFDPNDAGAVNNQIFGLPFNFDESEIVLLPVPWEVTVSYHAGTARGPHAIKEAAPQLDLYDYDYPEAWKSGFFMLDISRDWLRKSDILRPKAHERIISLEQGIHIEDNHYFTQALKEINRASEELNGWVFEQTTKLINRGKLPGIIGGEHSVPLGGVQAIGQKHKSFGILQIDAHADLRENYEGFTYSHASIMHHVLKLEQVEKLVQVGIRDVSPTEMDLINNNKKRISCFKDQDIQRARYEGQYWKDVCDAIISQLPQKVYISFDIDGLDPKLCPGTGTPVPGGLEMEETAYLLAGLVATGKEIIGFDLCEVSHNHNHWNGNVGARVLFKLCALAAKALHQNKT